MIGERRQKKEKVSKTKFCQLSIASFLQNGRIVFIAFTVDGIAVKPTPGVRDDVNWL